MNRLVQGDVGSGKTLVALLAMVVVVENGYQAAFMAPTEILAEQHFLTFAPAARCPYRVELLTSAVKGRERRDGARARSRRGEAQIVVGTHALIQEGVRFRSLGLAVVDEQHRFGVLQREDLRNKGYDADVLVMTATPIPRTLALTAYGDLDVSVVDEKPPGPHARSARWCGRPRERREVLELVRGEVAQGRQAYVVYPLVEESEKLEDVKAATEAAAEWTAGAARRAGGPPPRPDEERREGGGDGRLHARRDRRCSWRRPSSRSASTCRTRRVMVVEHAERFGLAQLHQLRGRVGRGARLLDLRAPRLRPPRPTWRARASTSWRATEDGFVIAERDLEIRGPGDFFGTRQWGMPTLPRREPRPRPRRCSSGRARRRSARCRTARSRRLSPSSSRRAAGSSDSAWPASGERRPSPFATLRAHGPGTCGRHRRVTSTQSTAEVIQTQRVGRLGCLLTAGLLAAGAVGPTAAEGAATAPGSSTAPPEVRRVVAGEEFDRGGKWRYWFGEGYRKAWTTPVELPVLDLSTEAGGLTPLRQVGGFQTEGLAMKGADGRGYTFRKLEKHPERVLPKEWQNSELRAIAVDQTAAAHPAATAIVGSLAQSVGILFYGSRLAVMPDDPALGEFRKTFGGTVGTFDEYLGPGYKGITEVVSSIELWQKWREGGPENRVDSRAFLKARLFDLVVGNWDRHQGQWRWARVAGKPLWEPLPEDADQAFTRYEGRAMGAVRSVVPRFMRYSGEYPKRMEGLTTNNYDVTRWLLADVEWPVFEEVARELAAQMTDAAIDEAMHQMPPEWYAIDGAQMTKDLRQRRDGIVAYARKFYLHLADRVDVRATDHADLADVSHFDDGSLQVTLSPLGANGAAGAPYYTRRFSPKETQEIRLYLLGGNDRVVASGPRRGGIHVRVLGGAGSDTVDDSQSGGLDVEDGRGDNVVRRGPGTKVSESEWKNPAPEKDRPWLEPRNYGHWTVPMAQVYWEPNQAFMLGGGVTRTSWGFRKYPWANMQAFTLLYSTGYNNVRASYGGQWRLSDTRHARSAGHALLRDREPELLRLRERDPGRPGEGTAHDRDQRVLGLPGPSLAARAVSSSCTSEPRRSSSRRRGATASSSRRRCTAAARSARRPCEPGSSTTRGAAASA